MVYTQLDRPDALRQTPRPSHHSSRNCNRHDYFVCTTLAVMDATPDSSVCHIFSLPDELIVAIASELRVERGFLNDTEAERERLHANNITIRGLCSLALTCRKLNGITYPILYQCIVRSPKKNFATSLFRTLFNNAKLSRHVRYVELEELDDFAPPLDEECTELDCSKFEELRRRAERLIWSPKPTGPILPIGTAKEPALLAAFNVCNFLVLASMLDNLQEAAVPMIQDVLLWLVFRPANRHDTLKRVWLRSGTTSSEETLNHSPKCKGPVEISGMEDHISFYLQHILDTLPPPKSHGRDGWPRLGPSVEDQPLARMEELSLSLYEVDHERIDHHIRGCATLERFSCVWYDTKNYVPQCVLDLPRLCESLAHVRGSLTHLTIDTLNYTWHHLSAGCIESLKSLQEFSALTYLSVDEHALWAINFDAPLSTILPRSLVTLIIKSGWSTVLEKALSELRADCTASLPNLKSVECTSVPMPIKFAYDSIAGFKDVGVDLSLMVFWMFPNESDSEDDIETGVIIVSSASLEDWVLSEPSRFSESFESEDEDEAEET